MTLLTRMTRPKDRVTDRRAEFFQRLREHDICRNVPLSHYASTDPLKRDRELPAGINAVDALRKRSPIYWLAVLAVLAIPAVLLVRGIIDLLTSP